MAVILSRSQCVKAVSSGARSQAMYLNKTKWAMDILKGDKAISISVGNHNLSALHEKHRYHDGKSLLLPALPQKSSNNSRKSAKDCKHSHW